MALAPPEGCAHWQTREDALFSPGGLRLQRRALFFWEALSTPPSRRSSNRHANVCGSDDESRAELCEVQGAPDICNSSIMSPLEPTSHPWPQRWTE
ncbi:hypothetical protein ZHAS_00013964 [Anopheles sinensis]|uniref:Uncharacterized protein n=1 Tax=Anopheles sinensis TaxID=74873 RepID=A0A084W6X7_ANOSI|nr:hypothetical protein ZHAS_00013964 [Anopheles sinensis]